MVLLALILNSDKGNDKIYMWTYFKPPYSLSVQPYLEYDSASSAFRVVIIHQSH